MRDLSRYEVDNSKYSRIISNQISNKRDLFEVITGKRKSVFRLEKPYIRKDKNGKEHIEYKTLLCTNTITQLVIGKLKKESFVRFLAEVKLNIHRNVIESPELLDLKIDYKNSKQGRNLGYWHSLPDESYFYSIDFKSAYWQMAYKIGYITETLYWNYMNLDDYKVAKRLCISFLGRSVTVNYLGKTFKNEENFGQPLIITCDNDSLYYKRIYKNIRNLLNNYLYDVVRLSNGNFIKYNTDGIWVTKESIEPIKKYLKDNDILFKTTLCKKISSTEFIQSKELINFLKQK
jgi:hypothetical protein